MLINLLQAFQNSVNCAAHSSVQSRGGASMLALGSDEPNDISWSSIRTQICTPLNPTKNKG